MVLNSPTLLLIQDIRLHLHLLKLRILVTVLLLLVHRLMPPLLTVVKQLRNLLELINNLELLRMLFILVQFVMVLQVFEIGSKDADAVEQMGPKIKVILLAEPQLIVIIIEALLRKPHDPRRLLQTHLFRVILALVYLPPPLHDFYHLEYHPLLAPLLLQRRRLRFFTTLVRSYRTARIARQSRDRRCHSQQN